MDDLVRLEIVLTKREARHLMNVIGVGNDYEDADDDTQDLFDAVDDVHTELLEATARPSTDQGFQNRLVISPAAFPLYQPVK